MNKMKMNCRSVRRTLFSVLGVLMFTLMYANESPNWRIVNAGLGKQFAMEIAGLEINAAFEIQTTNGRILASRSIPAPSFQGLFSLEDLPEGEYVLVLKTSIQEIYQPVTLSQRTVLAATEQRWSIHLPVVEVSGRQLDILYWNAEAEPVTLSLVEVGGEKLYEETIDEIIDIEKRLNLLQVPRGEYIVEVRTANNAWREPIHLR